MQLLVAVLCLVSFVNGGVLINEVNTEVPGASVNNAQYIELYNTDSEDVVLNNYSIALVGNDEKIYKAFYLDGYTIKGNDYLVLGHDGVKNVMLVFKDDGDVISSDAEIKVQGNAIVLYYGREIWAGQIASSAFMVDAIVHDNGGRNDVGLLALLTPQQNAVHEDSDFLQSDDESMSRCGGTTQAANYQFTLAVSTPGEVNDCTTGVTGRPRIAPVEAQGPTDIIINEVEADNPKQDEQEFIELKNLGAMEKSLDQYTLVLYAGNRATPSAYNVIPLTGQTIGANGYFVIGSSQVPNADMNFAQAKNNLQNQIAGVALYYGKETPFNIGMPVTKINMVDAIAYTTRSSTLKGYKGQKLQNFMNLFVPGQTLIFEDPAHTKENESMSRCFFTDSFRSNSYQLLAATPGKLNACGYPPKSIDKVIIGG